MRVVYYRVTGELGQKLSELPKKETGTGTDSLVTQKHKKIKTEHEI